MKAAERTLQQILHSPNRYVIPVFQRYYSWEKANWEQLWEDLLLLLESFEEKRRHFLGSIVCVPEMHMPGVPPAYQVIDGQQRLMTLSILLCAVRDVAKEKEWERLAAQIEKNYLIHEFEKDDERYKVYPRMRDREHYSLIVDWLESNGTIVLHPNPSYQVDAAYIYFLKQIEKEGFFTTEETLRNLFTAITTQIDFVLIVLDGENPYKIFKSLNSTGMDLGQGDLIRNHVFMAIPVNEQDAFDDRYWRVLEKHFEEGGKLASYLFTSFFRDVLMSEGNYVAENAVYEAFERKYPLNKIKPLDLVFDLEHKAKHYDLIRFNQAFQAIRDLSVTTSYPLILALLDAYEKQKLTEGELKQSLRAISGFVMRRHVCSREGSRAYNHWFCKACRELEDNPLANLIRYLTNKGWPNDDVFIQEFQRMKLYNSNYKQAILQGLEHALQATSEPVLLDRCQIEHVMPQVIANDKNGKAWKESLGEGWQRIQAEWLHTPGNLTLIGYDYNNEMRNRPFEDKKPLLCGSKVYLNKFFANADLLVWNEREIIRRGQELAKIAAKVWVGPNI